MNKVIMMGRVAGYGKATEGDAWYKLPVLLAVSRPQAKEGQQDTDFVPCYAWNKAAETMEKYVTKGDGVMVEGELRFDEYDDADGVHKKYSYVNITRFEFLPTRKPEEKKEEAPKKYSKKK